MQDTAYDEQTHSTGTFDIIKSLDKNVRELSDNLYDFKRDTNSRLSRLEQDIVAAKKDLISMTSPASKMISRTSSAICLT